jgi:RimJ/RimL family protein N-acetyltransferase
MGERRDDVTELHGHRVVLREFRPDEIDLAMVRMAGGSSMIPVGGPTDRQRSRRVRLERSGSRNDWEILFAIEAGGRLVGDVQGRCSDTAMPPGVWEIGVEVWDVADRGRGVGGEAVRVLTSYLFDREDAIRVQATTDLDNAAMRRVLERLGFGFEGVLRGFMPSADGAARDYTVYGMTRDDWENVKNGWIRTS